MHGVEAGGLPRTPCARGKSADLRGLPLPARFVKTQWRGLPRRRGEKRGLPGGQLGLYNIIIKDFEHGLRAIAMHACYGTSEKWRENHHCKGGGGDAVHIPRNAAFAKRTGSGSPRESALLPRAHGVLGRLPASTLCTFLGTLPSQNVLGVGVRASPRSCLARRGSWAGFPPRRRAHVWEPCRSKVVETQ